MKMVILGATCSRQLVPADPGVIAMMQPCLRGAVAPGAHDSFLLQVMEQNRPGLQHIVRQIGEANCEGLIRG